MKLRIVARSLGIILASPLVALPTWLASDGGLLEGGLVQKGFAQERQAPAAPPPLDPPRPEAPATRAYGTEPRGADAEAQAGASSPVEVSVTCGRRGCVVLDGLAVTVIESER